MYITIKQIYVLKLLKKARLNKVYIVDKKQDLFNIYELLRNNWLYGDLTLAYPFQWRK